MMGVAANIPVKLGRKPRFSGIPAVDESNPGSLWHTVRALTEVVETLIGQRGDTRNRAVLVNDMLLDSADPTKRVETEGIHNYLRADKVPDPAYAKMNITSDTGPFSAGNVIKPWLVTDPQPHNMAVNAPNGTITRPDTDRTLGVYLVCFDVQFTGSASGNYQFTLFGDGVASGSAIGTTFGTAQTQATLCTAFLVDTTDADRVTDWRLTTATSAVTIKRASFSLIRLAALAR